MEFNLADLFEAVADTVPDRTAVVAGDRRLTYRELDERANRVAQYLRDVGVVPGQHVGIYAYNCAEWVAVFWGCILRGAVVIPMDRTAAPDFVRRVADQVAPRLAVCSFTVGSISETVHSSRALRRNACATSPRCVWCSWPSIPRMVGPMTRPIDWPYTSEENVSGSRRIRIPSFSRR